MDRRRLPAGRLCARRTRRVAPPGGRPARAAWRLVVVRRLYLRGDGALLSRQGPPQCRLQQQRLPLRAMRVRSNMEPSRVHGTWNRAWRSFLAAALAALGVLAPSCTVPALNLAGKKECATASDCTPGQTCSSAGACMSLEGGVEGSPMPEGSTSMNLCTAIPHFSGPESVGGFEGDFSSVPDFYYPTLPTSTNLE